MLSCRSIWVTLLGPLALHRPGSLALLVALAIFAATGCSTDDKPVTGNVGYIHPSVTVSGADAPDVTDFSITVTAADGSSSSWSSVDEFPLTQGFIAGSYTIEAASGLPQLEGYGYPYYYGEASVAVLADRTAEVTVECERRNVAFFIVRDESFTDDIAESAVILHAYGGGYLDVNYSATEPLYIRQGLTDVLLHFRMRDGREASVLAARFTTAEGDDVTLTLAATQESATTGTITLSVGPETFTVELSDELFDTPLPVISTSGFTSDSPLLITEGIAPDSPVVMTVTSESPLREAVLTVQAPALIEHGLQPEVNLITTDDATRSSLSLAGIVVTHSADLRSLTIDYTAALPHLLYDASGVMPRLSLIALDELGQLSLPSSLTVNVASAQLSVTDFPSVVYGSAEASVTIAAPSAKFIDNLAIEVSDSDSAWSPAVITACEPADTDGEYRVTFDLPAYRESTVKVRFRYMDATFDTRTLTFTSPDYTIEVDAFAHHALVRVTAASDDIRALVTEAVNIYVNGSWAHVYSRQPDTGILWITGLQEDTDYTFEATIYGNPVASDFTPVVAAHTESPETIPNGDFEDTVEDIIYEGLPSGGYYSQSPVPLYNRLNRVDLRVNVPKSPWTTVNAKTFWRSAVNQNSWYLQPSAMESSDIISGAVSVRLVSVAFDPAGEDIPPYRQLSEPYISYNPYVPAIAYRAAGKLFLGSYAYHGGTDESYAEGYPFGARPSAVNGIYRYMPGASAPEDCGRVDITVSGYVNGSLQPIATATGRLYPSTTNATFSVPITYDVFGVKAAAISVMLSSSYDIGSIDYETANIHTTPDALSASSTGSVLEVDNVTLSY